MYNYLTLTRIAGGFLFRSAHISVGKYSLDLNRLKPIIKAFDKAKLLDDYTYKRLMSILFRAKKVRVEDEDWQLVKMNPSHMEILQNLGLIPKPEEPPKKKRGRPKGSKSKAVPTFRHDGTRKA